MKVQIKVLDYFYYNNNSADKKYNAPVLVIVGRDKDLKFHMVNVLDKDKLMCRIGISNSDAVVLEKFKKDFGTYGENIVDIIPDAPNSLHKEKVSTLLTTFPYQVNKIKGRLSRTYQADVKWEKMAMSRLINECGLEGSYIEIPGDYVYRFLELKDIRGLKKNEFFSIIEKICYWDIETDSRLCYGRRIKFEDYKLMPLISLSDYDNHNDRYYIFLWHPDFKEDQVRSFDNYEIKGNVFRDKKVVINKLIIYEFTSEEKVLRAFFNHFSDEKFDRMFGYWSTGGMKKPTYGGKMKRQWFDGFDIQCLYVRALELGLLEDMQKMSVCPFLKKHWGGGYEGVSLRTGENKHQVLIKGVGQLDFVISDEWIQFSQKYYNFRGWKLEHWMDYFLSFNKLDKGKLRVWEYWLQKDCTEEDFDEAEIINGVPRIKGKGLEFMIDYNIVDVYGVVELDKLFNVSKNQSGRTEVSISPFADALYPSKLHDHYKLTKYQNTYSFDTKYQNDVEKRKPYKIKETFGEAFTITLKDLEEQARKRGKEVTYDKIDDIGKIGGYVAKPVPKEIYYDILTIDFSKFYPNMIKSINAGIVSAINLASFDDEYVWDIDGTAYKREALIETPITFFRKDIPSINAKLFDDWMVKRVEAQNRLQLYVEANKTTKSNTYNLLWSEQFNIKNFMNAGFGVLGLPVDRAYSLLGFNACTVSCQDIIMFVINKLIEWDINILGGDSVTKDTPLVLLDGRGEINIKTIETIGKKFNKVGYKEIGVPKFDYKIWTDKGYSKIKKVIRHKTNKRIYRILTNCGCVDVTEDHSLLNDKGIEVKPSELSIGDELLHSFPLINNIGVGKNIEEEAKIFGLFYADGSCGKYINEPIGYKYSWAINNKDYELLEETKNILNNLYKEKGIQFKILNTLKSSNVYKLVPYGKIKPIVDKYRKLFYDKDKYKKIPKIVLNSNEISRRNFFDWYYKGDGSKTDGRIRLDNKGKIGTACLHYIMKSLGYNVSINTRESKPDIFRLNGNKTYYFKSPTKIKKIIDLGICDDYVYDLETENHRFQAGIGELIVHNTDSTFIQGVGETPQDLEKYGKDLCSKLNEEIKAYMWKAYNIAPEDNFINIGLETISDKFYVDTKKHYIKRNIYVAGVFLDKPELEVKGLQLKKRDTSQIGADIQTKLIDILFKEKSPLTKMQDYVLEIEDKIRDYSWSYVCKHGALNKDLDKYPDSNESATAARNTLKYLGKYMEPGSNPYIGVFCKYPSEMNGKFLNGSGLLKISFEDEDEVILRELGFELDYDNIRETECVAKSDHILEVFDEDWNSLKEAGELGSILDV